MSKQSLLKSTIKLLPLLILYIILVFVFSKNELHGDEDRHLAYATNLTQGFYADEVNPSLVNGPGYPMVIAPFVAMNASYLFIKILNAVFVFIGVVYFKKTITFFTKEKYAIGIACLIGLYPPLLRYMPLIYSEPFSFMLICALFFHVFKLYRNKEFDWKHISIASLYLGLLILTKIIFLQVITVSILLIGILFLWKRKRQNIKVALVLVGGFLLIIPYIIYAFSVTGKPFYLGTGGGEILYHRSTPYENEWGNWFSIDDALNGGNPEYQPDNKYRDLNTLSKNHHDVFAKLETLTHIERDSVLKAIAIENMKANPSKYLKNTVSNVGRLLFHYPFSYREQNLNAFGYMIPNMFIIVLWVLSLYPAFLARKRVPFELIAALIFTLIYACGIVVADGRGRNFVIIVPALVLFFAYIFTNVLNITLVKLKE
ncbi:MAG: hypothetical protein AB8B59_03685 [Maribacter sp.]